MAIREYCKTFLYLQFCSFYTILSRGAGCICKVVSYDWNTFIGLDWPQEPIHFRELMGLSMCQVCNQAARRSVDLILQPLYFRNIQDPQKLKGLGLVSRPSRNGQITCCMCTHDMSMKQFILNRRSPSLFLGRHY